MMKTLYEIWNYCNGNPHNTSFAANQIKRHRFVVEYNLESLGLCRLLSLISNQK